jgi:hypothetical protein
MRISRRTQRAERSHSVSGNVHNYMDRWRSLVIRAEVARDDTVSTIWGISYFPSIEWLWWILPTHLVSYSFRSRSWSWTAQWPCGLCARRAIAEPKQCSQRPVIGRVTKIYCLELLRASEGKLSRWSRHLQSLAPTSVSRRVDVSQAVGRN